MSSKILFVGMGAVGCLYASLCNDDTHIDCVSQSNSDEIRQHGITIINPDNSKRFWQADSVFSSIDVVPYSPDYIVITTKVLPSIYLIPALRKIISDKTTVVLLQNGIHVEHPYIDAFPNTPIISGLAFVCATKMSATTVHHHDYGAAVFGLYPKGKVADIMPFINFFSQSTVNILASDDIYYHRFKKLLWNAPFNPLSVILKGKNTQELLSIPGQEVHIRCIMKEIQLIAKAEGVYCDDAVIEKHIQDTKKMRPYKTSMCIDWEQGRALERDAILGNAIKCAKKHKLDCPYITDLYNQLHHFTIEH